MNKILTNNIAPGKGQAFGKHSLNHLQSAFSQVTEALVQAINKGRKAVVYLDGCSITSVGNIHSNAAGWAYHNGEVFQVPAGSVNTSGSPEWVIQQDFVTGDEVPFSNLDMHDVLAIRTLRLAAPGSGGVAITEAESYPSLLSTMHGHSTEQIAGLAEALNLKASRQQPVFALLNYNSGINHTQWPSLKYMKDTVGTVHLSGVRVAQSGSSILGTLPEGFRPVEMQVIMHTSLSGNLIETYITPTGNIQVSRFSGSFTGDEAISFSGITFQTTNEPLL